MARTAFYKGIRLWQVLQEMPDWASRSGQMDHEGVRHTYKKGAGNSPNFERPVEVMATVDVDDFTSVPGYEPRTAIDNTLHAVELKLISEAATEGDLCYCEDNERMAAVSGSHGAGGAVVVGIGAAGGGWVTAVGQRVLFRNKTTNAGFASEISAVGPGAITCALDVDITNAWEVVRVERVLPSTWFLRMTRAGSPDPSDPESFVREVTYSFMCYAGPEMPTASILAHT